MSKILILIIILWIPPPVFSQQFGVSRGECELRSSTASGKKLLTIIPKGDTLSIIGTWSDWHKVKYNGLTGFVPQIYVHTEEQLKTINQKWGKIMYARSNINVRSSPSTKSQINLKLNKGDTIKVDNFLNNWYQVYTSNESNKMNGWGYVYAPLLSKKWPPDKIEKTPFTIVEKQDVSYLGKTRMVYRIVINTDKLPSEKELKDISNSIWKNGNTKWGEFTVFSYLPGMNTSSMSYGNAEFRPSGMIEFSIQKYSLMGTKWSK